MAVILKAAIDILQQMSMVTQYSDLKTKKTCKNMSNDATKLEKNQLLQNLQNAMKFFQNIRNN